MDVMNFDACGNGKFCVHNAQCRMILYTCQYLSGLETLVDCGLREAAGRPQGGPNLMPSG